MMKYIDYKRVVPMFLGLTGLMASTYADEIEYQHIVDVQNSVRLQLDKDGNQLQAISGVDAQMLSTDEQALADKLDYVVWKQSYESPKIMMRRHAPDVRSAEKERVQLAIKEIPQIKARVPLYYPEYFISLKVLLRTGQF